MLQQKSKVVHLLSIINGTMGLKADETSMNYSLVFVLCFNVLYYTGQFSLTLLIYFMNFPITQDVALQSYKLFVFRCVSVNRNPSTMCLGERLIGLQACRQWLMKDKLNITSATQFQSSQHSQPDVKHDVSARDLVHLVYMPTTACSHTVQTAVLKAMKYLLKFISSFHIQSFKQCDGSKRIFCTYA